MKLQLICETLLLDSAKDMEEFLKSCATSEFHELKKLVQLRIDIIKPMWFYILNKKNDVNSMVCPQVTTQEYCVIIP